MRKTAIVIGVGLVLLLVALGLRGGGDAVEVELGEAVRRDVFRSFVTASGEIVAERYADIGSSIMGRVVELPVEEGQRVERGELLARIDPVQARSELEAAEALVRALEAEARGAADQVESAAAELRLAEARCREVEASYERTAALFEDELVPQADLDAAQAAADSAAAQVAGAEAAVARARYAEEAARRRVAQARAQAARAQDLVLKTAITAPISGVISRLQVREGEMVVVGIQNQPGTVLMTVSDLSELNAEVEVAEADVLRVAVGQTAKVTLEALPEQELSGTVTEVGASALPRLDAGAAAREFRVEIRLDEVTPGMRPGLTCDAEILVGEQHDVITVPLQAVVLRTVEGGVERRGVFTLEHGVARFVPVETGIIGGLEVEVEGLAEGRRVISGPYQELRELQDGDHVRVR